MTLYFTSDIHFNHRFMAELRGYETREEMNDDLIQQWNDLISNKDEIWVLGDFTFGPKKFGQKVFSQLNGQKHLIIGNHDAPWARKMGWASVNQMKSKHFDGEYKVFLCHYPMLTWPNAHHGVWHLHEHSHNNLPPTTNTRMDVGIDAIKKIAITSDEVIEIMQKREYDKIDHHEYGDDD